MAGRAELVAVVAGDGYGHGAVRAARAALAGGATRLAVSSAAEAHDLREAGIDAPLIVVCALTPGEIARAVAARAEVVLSTPAACAAAAAAGRAAGAAARVHLELDTGLRRLGAPPDQVDALTDAAGQAGIEVVGVMTQLATAEEREGAGAAFFREQLVRFRASAQPLRRRFPGARLHAANSAATVRDPSARLDMVRCGAALYGCSPFGGPPEDHGLRPAMSLISRVACLRRDATVLATVPVGYADGYPRAPAGRAHALVAGRPAPVVGRVGRDRLIVDLGPHASAGEGDEVVLLGAQGDARVTAEDLGAWRDASGCQIVCTVGARAVREHHG